MKILQIDIKFSLMSWTEKNMSSTQYPAKNVWPASNHDEAIRQTQTEDILQNWPIPQKYLTWMSKKG